VKAKTYFGKVCAQHPELKGARDTSTRHCIPCKRAYSLNWRTEHHERHLATKARYRLRMQGKSEESPSPSRRGLTDVTTKALVLAWVGTVIFGRVK